MLFASTPSKDDVPAHFSINTLIAERVSRTGDGTLLERRENPGAPWTRISANEFAAEVTQVAAGLLVLGVEAGDRVAIMSRTRYEWTLLDFAIWAVGGVPVPIYETSAPDQVQWILSDAGCRFAIVENATHLGIVDAVRAGTPILEQVLVLDPSGTPALGEESRADTWCAGMGAIAALKTKGAEVAEARVVQRRDAVVGADLATIIYTSGSTGRPKGTELTHSNFTTTSRAAADCLQIVIDPKGEPARTLLFLPLAHVFARLIEVAVLAANTVLAHAPDVRNLMDDLGSFKPTFLLAVPRVFEKVYNSASQKAATSKAKQVIFHNAVATAISYSRALDAPGGVPPQLKIRHAVADRLVLSKLRAALGGQCAYAVSGGAPLGERLGHFFRGVGVAVLEGYGLTETTAPTAVNFPKAVGVGTVGQPMPGTSIKLDDDGEVLVKGPHVMRGYRNQPELTAEVLQDGWFRTGDIGTLDAAGRLTITGRKKEIIVTAGGKNVAPALLEDRLRSHPIVSQVVVVGDQRPFIGALITLDAEMLPNWLATHGLPNMPVSEARTNEVVLARLGRAVERANAAVSRAESIRKFHVLETDFTEANGYLTPSMKVKRSLVCHDFADTIDSLYNAG